MQLFIAIASANVILTILAALVVIVRDYSVG